MNRYLFSFAVILFLATSVPAVTLIVTSDGESHDPLPGDGLCSQGSDCTIRAAVEEANANSAIDTILVPSSITYVELFLGPLVISTDSLTLRTAAEVTLDGFRNPWGSTSLLLRGRGNKVEGVRFTRSRGSALTIVGGSNQVGGLAQLQRNVFVNNCLDILMGAAILIRNEEAVNNSVVGNHIGLESDGMTANGNPNGIRVEGNAWSNTLRNNVISGNRRFGVVLDNSSSSRISGNFIGPDAGGFAGPGNDSGGIVIENGSDSTIVGGIVVEERNLISANGGDGILIRDLQTNSNTVSGNYIGTDVTGRLRLGNKLSGVRITMGSQGNVIGGEEAESRNVVSGNSQHGIAIIGSETATNIIAANYVGTAANGFSPLGNGYMQGSGIYIAEQAHHNVIGLPVHEGANTIAGNHFNGIHLSSGANHNRIQNNIIGLNAAGTSSLPNVNGVVLDGSAHNNLLGGGTFAEGNLISGNRGDQFPDGAGVIMYGFGTSYNTISANYVGCDASGTRALRNGSAGILVGYGASNNRIGGTDPGEGNVISGNGTGTYTNGLARGIQLFGNGTAFNEILGNLIGATATGVGSLSNRGHGIGLYGGAQYNRIGDGTDAGSNVVKFNAGFGIYLSDSATAFNRIESNQFEGNDSLAITIRNGAQGGVSPPHLFQSAQLMISGRTATPFSIVELYLAAPNMDGRGEGKRRIGRKSTDSVGGFDFLLEQLSNGDTVTALATDPQGNSGEFSENLIVSTVTGVEGPTPIPLTFELRQNYPNPFNPSTTIVFVTPQRAPLTLAVFNALGQHVRTLLHESIYEAGSHTLTWDGRTEEGDGAASGIYFYRLSSSHFTATRMMVLLK